MYMPLRLWIIFSIVFTSLCQAYAQNSPKPKPVIRQVDHIVIQTDDLNSLFNFFTVSLVLPVARPIADYADYASAGIALSNASLELFQYKSPRKNSQIKSPRAYYTGIALEPYPLSESISRMQARGIAYEAPKPFSSVLPDGSQGVAWITLSLPELSKPGMSIFLLEYNPAFLKMEVRRKQWANRLVLDKGGPLGLLSTSELTIGVKDPNSSWVKWRQLLGPEAAPNTDLWHAGNGPEIRLVPTTEDKILNIILKVRQLAQARTFLSSRMLIGKETSGKIFLNPKRSQGLSICIVEEK